MTINVTATPLSDEEAYEAIESEQYEILTETPSCTYWKSTVDSVLLIVSALSGESMRLQFP